MTPPTKGGRPAKGLHQKQKYQINIKLNTLEFMSLKAKASAANMSTNDFVRLCIERSNVVARLSVDDARDVRNLCNMGNNLNQIAKRANQAGYLDVRGEYLGLAQGIEYVIKRLIDDSKNSKR